MSAKLKEDEFRDRFDAGESLESLGFDLEGAVIEEPQHKRVNVDFPEAVVAKLDRYASLMGVTRQALIKVWIFERLKQEAAQPESRTLSPLSRPHRSIQDAIKAMEENINKVFAEVESKKQRT
jgi:hypothetical protein